jgi:hypothetical protein
LWGVDRWKHAGGLAVVLFCAGLAALASLAWTGRSSEVGRRAEEWLAKSPWRALAVGALAGVAFFLLRSAWVNPDGQLFVLKFREAVPTAGYFATHDELWELYLHSRFWFWTERAFGWSVELSYQVLSCAGGALFVALLVRYALFLLPGRALGLALAVLSGGFVQLFFGDVENYTLTAACALLYLHLSARHLRGELSLFWPGAALGLALSFHLLTVFLGPSLVYLCARQIRLGRWAPFLRASLGFWLVFGATLTFFRLKGLPIQSLWTESHATAKGGDVGNYLADPSLQHYWHQTQLLLLLAPCALLLPLLLAFRRFESDPVDVHLAVASAGLLAFHFAIKGFLGIYYDWDLFANVAVPLSALVWLAALREPSRPTSRVALALLVGAFALHSLSWVVSNHAFEPYAG